MARTYTTIFAICKAHQLDYKDVVREYTGGETDSLRSLTDYQVENLEARLKALSKGDFKPKPGDAQRKKFISLAGKMRWGTTTLQIVKALDNWCLKQKYRKKLNDLNEAELNVLLTVFEAKVYSQYLSGIHK
ncbi:hypothetical protein Pedsa_0961 [Pseudopedobacter saltans DSM 12145]|uniref:Uncharacterized protein n=1 Tax=Pseudopedobacter saltans (strain ATCC 51119 / DSM 12145 / JCM 21818 / CCUG 39354 / LMG 10337 / NBRC 100064 / NCIMB 13643) TaxID=762903 RepID=F0SAT8_PSESL|nr:hypothetical protein [Pseudopedobacter saltans]ADY51533.1 hypothetical protein Pedsa_0961 [Pseudopedobacter saltans DSM 12145]